MITNVNEAVRAIVSRASAVYVSDIAHHSSSNTFYLINGECIVSLNIYNSQEIRWGDAKWHVFLYHFFTRPPLIRTNVLLF